MKPNNNYAGKPMTRAEVLALWKPQPLTLGNRKSYFIARVEGRGK